VSFSTIILVNHIVSRCGRIAQLICQKIYSNLEELNILDITERGDGGFGSTGKN